MVAVACSRTSERQDVALNVELLTPLFPPPVGQCPLAVRVTDEKGNPLEDLQVSFRGDMTHAGMAPIMVTAEHAGTGTYRALMDWTMAGDWVITVDVALSDGRRASRQFDFSVTTGEAMCSDVE